MFPLRVCCRVAYLRITSQNTEKMLVVLCFCTDEFILLNWINRFTTGTENTRSSKYGRHRRRRRRHRMPPISRVSLTSHERKSVYLFYFIHFRLKLTNGKLTFEKNSNSHSYKCYWYEKNISPTVWLHTLSFIYMQLSLFFQASSFSSITDSTMSLNIITVTLNMGRYCNLTAVKLPHQ